MKAKQEPTRRFHFLYDKVWRGDILAHAYALSRTNGGAPGVEEKPSRASRRAEWVAGSTSCGRTFERDVTNRNQSDG